MGIGVIIKIKCGYYNISNYLVALAIYLSDRPVKAKSSPDPGFDFQFDIAWVVVTSHLLKINP